jgi:hypothetical protein
MTDQPPTAYSPSKKTLNTSTKASSSKAQSASGSKKNSVLNCGKPVNFTQFDHLRGIADRHSHPSIPEPEVALIFKKKSKTGSQEVDMNELEKKLRKTKKEVL